MAGTMTIKELRETLRNEKGISDSAFTILKSVSALVNDEKQAEAAREMVLRALEHRKEFGEYASASFAAEIRRHLATFADKGLPTKVRVHLFLLPLKSKKELVAVLDQRLKVWQAL